MPGIVLKWLLLVGVIVSFSAFTFTNETGKPVEKLLHPFYVTVIEINHNTNPGSLEISCKLFADDFEDALKKEYKTTLDLHQPKDRQHLEKLIFAYLQKHFQLKVNGKPVLLSFVGFEIESEAAWCYLEVKPVTNVKSLDISNDLLYESYPSQISIIHAVADGKRKSTRLINPEKQATFHF